MIAFASSENLAVPDLVAISPAKNAILSIPMTSTAVRDSSVEPQVRGSLAADEGQSQLASTKAVGSTSKTAKKSGAPQVGRLISTNSVQGSSSQKASGPGQSTQQAKNLSKSGSNAAIDSGLR